MDAIDLLRQFARRWAVAHRLDQEALLGGGRECMRVSRVREQFCFLASNLAKARDDLIGEALSLHYVAVFDARRRYFDRHKSNAALAAYADLLVQSLSERDPVFFEMLIAAVKAETDRRIAATAKSRAHALALTAQSPDFEARRRAALTTYFDGGGRLALSDRSRGNKWAAKSET